MTDFVTSLLAAIILIPVMGAVAHYALKWIKVYFKHVESDGGFIDYLVIYLVICLCILFAAVKVAQFIGTTFAGVQY